MKYTLRCENCLGLKHATSINCPINAASMGVRVLRRRDSNSTGEAKRRERGYEKGPK